MDSNHDIQASRVASHRAALRLAPLPRGTDAGGAAPQTWISAAPRSPGYGLPGSVQLAPSVWLCCVYLSSQASERVDAGREALRLDTLMRAAADAWSRQHRVAGAQGTTCVFCFRPDFTEAPGSPAIGSSPGFLIRINVLPGPNGELLTRLDFAG
jgi:hypothetical protein